VKKGTLNKGETGREQRPGSSEKKQMSTRFRGKTGNIQMEETGKTNKGSKALWTKEKSVTTTANVLMGGFERQRLSVQGKPLPQKGRPSQGHASSNFRRIWKSKRGKDAVFVETKSIGLVQ